jgi:hypothetical protein
MVAMRLGRQAWGFEQGASPGSVGGGLGSAADGVCGEDGRCLCVVGAAGSLCLRFRTNIERDKFVRRARPLLQPVLAQKLTQLQQQMRSGLSAQLTALTPETA